jgi:hypothetical protein
MKFRRTFLLSGCGYEFRWQMFAQCPQGNADVFGPPRSSEPISGFRP